MGGRLPNQEKEKSPNPSPVGDRARAWARKIMELEFFFSSEP